MRQRETNERRKERMGEIMGRKEETKRQKEGGRHDGEREG
jgi:hypothetical protein